MSKAYAPVMLAGLLCLLALSSGPARHADADEPKSTTLEELDNLPTGIKVTHEPKVALATLSGKSERRSKYTWW